MKRIFSVMLTVLLLLSTAGCDQVSGLIPSVLTPGAVSGTLTAAATIPPATPEPGGSSTPAGSVTQTAAVGNGTPQALITQNPGAEETLPEASGALTIWLPPTFDPEGGTPAGDLLAARLEAFETEYGVPVEVRVKSETGPGGLLESLNAANAAAPLALPSVIALSRSDLEAAALKGLLYPLDGSSSEIDNNDWYEYARQLAMVQGATFSLPFAGDALVLAFRPAQVESPPSDWASVFRLGQPLAFPASDAQAMFILALYQSLGGEVEDTQRRPMLQPEVLTEVLQVLADGEERGIFPFWLSQYETYSQVWTAYQQEQVHAAVIWSSQYLSSLPADTAAVALPSLGEDALTLATGWGWAVTDPVPERRNLSLRLVEFLAEANFLAGWTEAAGYLPTRPSALAAWGNGSLKTLLSPVAISAQARPSNDLLASQGTVLKDAALKVLKHELEPMPAAQEASEKLTIPQNR